MKTGWKEVARLGTQGSRYPHVLVDTHGWCLRLGPDPRRDDKFFSRLSPLLEGLIEHLVRRRLILVRPILDIRELAEEVRGGIKSAVAMAGQAALESQRMSSDASHVLYEGPEARKVIPTFLRAFQAYHRN